MPQAKRPYTWVRISILLAGFGVVIGCLAGRLEAQVQFAQPAADAGTVRAGQPLVHEFEFVNTGNQPLEFLDARGSCACMKPKLPAGPIPPGGKGCVELAVHTLGQPAGPTAWAAQVKYRHGQQLAETTLVLKARVFAEIAIEPAALQLFAGNQLATQLTLTNLQRPQFGIRSIQASRPALQVRAVPATPTAGQTKQQYIVQVAVTPDYPEGRFEEIISIYTDDPIYPELKIPLTVVKQSAKRVLAHPQTVDIQGPAGQALPARIVLLRAEGDQPVRVDQLSADHPAIRCTWAQGPGTMATLRITVDQDMLTSQVVRGQIQVQIAQPVPQKLSIPVVINAGGP